MKIIAHRHYFYPNFGKHQADLRVEGVSDSYRKGASTSYRWCYCPLKKEHETRTEDLQIEYRYGEHNLPPFEEL